MSNRDDKDVWDETLLFKRYDASVKLSREALAQRIADSTNRREEIEVDEENDKHDLEHSEDTPFKVGDFARATYTDGIDYEGTIVSIDEKAATCILRYVGYENDQEIPLGDLLKSWGPEERCAQVEESKKADVDEEQQVQQRSKAAKKQAAPAASKASSKQASGSRASGLTMPPMPLVPPMFSPSAGMEGEPDQDFVAMLTAWYMSGYYTGLYQGKKESSAKKKTPKK